MATTAVMTMIVTITEGKTRKKNSMIGITEEGEIENRTK
jgi:hypothetical protein